MARTKITRFCPGEYEVNHGEYTATISRHDDLEYQYGQWVVSANWDRSLYSDPIIYLKHAKHVAEKMVGDVIMDDLRRISESNRRRMEALAS